MPRFKNLARKAPAHPLAGLFKSFNLTHADVAASIDEKRGSVGSYLSGNSRTPERVEKKFKALARRLVAEHQSANSGIEQAIEAAGLVADCA